VAVHFTSPVPASRPSKVSSPSAVGVHVVPNSRRFTKKSLVSVSGFWVNTPCGER
jgi:hypothetical protein